MLSRLRRTKTYLYHRFGTTGLQRMLGISPAGTEGRMQRPQCLGGTLQGRLGTRLEDQLQSDTAPWRTWRRKFRTRRPGTPGTMLILVPTCGSRFGTLDNSLRLPGLCKCSGGTANSLFDQNCLGTCQDCMRCSQQSPCASHTCQARKLVGRWRHRCRNVRARRAKSTWRLPCDSSREGFRYMCSRRRFRFPIPPGTLCTVLLSYQPEKCLCCTCCNFCGRRDPGTNRPRSQGS